ACPRANTLCVDSKKSYDKGHDMNLYAFVIYCTTTRGATVVQEVNKSFSNQKVASSIPCRSILEQDTEPLIAPDVHCVCVCVCAISVNVKCVYIVSRTYVSRFG